MDWKIPATIIILIAVVSLGVLPFFSTDFSNSLTGVFSSVRDFFDNMDFFDNIFHRETEFKENVVLSLSTTKLNELKIGIPTEIYLDLNGNYNLNVDNKNLTVKQNMFLNNFTGTLNFVNFSIAGSVSGISASNFDLYGKSKVWTNNENFEELKISNLQFVELTINKGKIKTESPQKIEAEIEDKIKLYGFKGSMTYKNNTVEFYGSCTKVQTKGFTLGG